jgi:hypothetical protein
MTSNHEDYSDEIAACKAEMKPLQLTWKSLRVRKWIFARTGQYDAHYLSCEDLQALADAIAQSKTPEFHECYLELMALMRELELSFDSPVIKAWMRQEGVLDNGLDYSLVRQLIEALKTLKEDAA